MTWPLAAVSAPAGVLLDVVEEHLDELGFMLAQRDRGLLSPCITLQEQATSIESRLLAQLDALVVQGPTVAEAVLAPHLTTEHGQPYSWQAAALALFEQQRPDALEAALSLGTSAQRRAIACAGALSPQPTVDDWVVDRFKGEFDTQTCAVLLHIAAARGVAIPDLRRNLHSRDPQEQAAAAAAARWSAPDQTLKHLERLFLTSGSGPEHVLIASTARRSALLMGSPKAHLQCLQAATQPDSPAAADPTALLVAALWGGTAQHEGLMARVARPAPCEHALFALGYTGNQAVVPLLVAQLAQATAPRVRRLAALALTTLTGRPVPKAPPNILPPPTTATLPNLAQDLQQQLVPHPLDALPLPTQTPLPAEAWLPETPPTSQPTPILLGQAFSPDQALRALEQLPLRCRPPLALWLELVTQGLLRVDPGALCCTQRSQMASARNGLQANNFTLPPSPAWLNRTP